MHIPEKKRLQFVPDALTTVKVSSHVLLAAMEPTSHIPNATFVCGSSQAYGGSPRSPHVQNVTQRHEYQERMITQFIRQCPCCQVINWSPVSHRPLKVDKMGHFCIKDHNGPLKVDILVIIDVFPTTSVSSFEIAFSYIQHFRWFGIPATTHTDT